MPSKKAYTVGEYMNTRVACVSKDATVQEVVFLMIKKKTNGLVVIDNNKKVVGILSSWDIIKHITPDYLEEDVHLASFEAADVFEQRIAHIANDTIDKFMTTHVHCAKKDMPLIQAAALLSEFHIRQLPVIDEEHHLIGYINRTDLKIAAGDILKKL